jgi:hypothetical protein
MALPPALQAEGSARERQRCGQGSFYGSSGLLTALTAALEDMWIDHGGADILVAREFLHGADVIAVFQQMGRAPLPRV